MRPSASACMYRGCCIPLLYPPLVDRPRVAEALALVDVGEGRRCRTAKRQRQVVVIVVLRSLNSLSAMHCRRASHRRVAELPRSLNQGGACAAAGAPRPGSALGAPARPGEPRLVRAADR